MKNDEFPPLTQQPLLNVDMTPDDKLAIRILEAYRYNCDSKWATSSDGSCDNPIYALMNQYNDERAVILDKAIEKLKLEA
jgi:hypothetical protein